MKTRKKRIENLEAKVKEMEKSIWFLQNPQKFEIGERVMYRSQTSFIENPPRYKVTVIKAEVKPSGYGFCRHYTVFHKKSKLSFWASEYELEIKK